jgi:hypothetical protein
VSAHSKSDREATLRDRTDARADVFDRTEELDALRQRVAQRRPFLFHGPGGVGKTLLLSAVLSDFPDILYSGSNPSPQALYRKLAELLLALGHPVFTSSCPSGPVSLQAKSAVSAKGLVRDALLNSKYLVVVDHLMRPSQALAAAIRELMLNWSVPVVAVARSAHMEDVGFASPLFPDRGDKLALRNFDPDLALQFALTFARREALGAENLAEFLARVVEFSDGNPGAIVRMIRLAREPRYFHGRQIKITPLYIDYKIAMVSE